MSDTAKLLDDGQEQIVGFPPGYLDGVDEAVITRSADGFVLPVTSDAA